MAEPLRIVHVVTPRSWRGGEQQAAYLIGELAAAGQHQLVVCTEESEMAAWCQRNGHEHQAFPKRSGTSLSFARNLSRVAKQQRAQIIHAHGSHAHTAAVLASAFFGNRAPLVISRRVDFPISKSPLSRWKYNHAAIKKIICVSKAIQEMTARDLKNKQVITTVHSGIDTSKFHPEQRGNKLREEFNIPEDLKLVGNVAALAPHKDYFTFVDTVKLLVQEKLPAHFLIFGKGPVEQDIRQYVKDQGMEAHITFTGFRTDIPEVLPELDVFLITSETEGLGTSILDALACQVPVVATNAGGIPEIIQHQKTGWLGQVKDPASLAEGVRAVLNDPALRSQLVSGGLKHLQQFDKAETARQTLAIYRQIAGA